MDEFSVSGGAYIGTSRASKPLANLTVNKNVLKISTGLFGQVFFNAGDITSIEPTSGLRGSGIKIIHTVPQYPADIVFSTGMPYPDVINAIKATGFFDKGTTPTDQTQFYLNKKFQEQGRLPIKTNALIVLFIAWILPFLASFVTDYLHTKTINPVSVNAPISLGFVIVFALLLLSSDAFRQLVLKEDRDIKDLRKSIYILLLICGIMFIVFSIVPRVISPA